LKSFSGVGLPISESPCTRQGFKRNSGSLATGVGFEPATSGDIFSIGNFLANVPQNKKREDAGDIANRATSLFRPSFLSFERAWLSSTGAFL